MLKRGIIVAIFLFLVLLGQSRADELDEFLPSSVVLPPTLPEEEMQEKSILSLTLKDYNTKEIIGDIHADMIIIDKVSGIQTQTLKYVPENGIIDIFIEPSEYTIIFKVDVITTPGRDYYFKSDFNALDDIEQTIYLLPAGSAIGIIYDNKGNMLREAKISFHCNKDYCTPEPTTTDDFGVFNADWLPIGSCRVSAKHGNSIVHESIEINQGQLTEIEVTLNKSISSNLIFYIIIMATILIIIFYFRRQISQSLKKKEEKIVELKKEVKEDKRIIKEQARIKDILKTLNEKENLVVNYILDHENKSTQSTLKHELSIPKTTLSRLLEKLESKQIVKIERIGKMKKIEFTDWFIGKR